MTEALDISAKDLRVVQAVLAQHLPTMYRVLAFGSRVTGEAKPYSDLDLALEDPAGTPIPLHVFADLEHAFDDSDLPWRVDLIDLNTITEEFRRAVISQSLPL